MNEASAGRPLPLPKKIFSEEDVEIVALAITNASGGVYDNTDGWARYVLTALAAAGRLLPPSAEHREEWAVHWLTDRGGIAMVNAQLASRQQAEDLGPKRVGRYNIASYTIHRRLHQRLSDGSTLIGPWTGVDRSTDA